MRKKEDPGMLTKEQKEAAVASIRAYFPENLDCEISGLQAGFFLDFLGEKIAPYYYNQAIADAMAFITDKTEDMYLLMKDE